jgi:magnesium-transporting ATPase (P-type)
MNGEQIEKLSVEEVECDLTILGVTGVEDLL